jgi:hypothetical protein
MAQHSQVSNEVVPIVLFWMGYYLVDFVSSCLE